MEAAPLDPRIATVPRWARWDVAVVFGAMLFFAYTGNGRVISTWDSLPASLLPIALVRGDGLVLDRFQAQWPGPLPYYVALKRGHLVSRYPVAIPLLATPLIAPQIALLDVLRPSWERERPFHFAEKMAKNAAALIAALTGIAMLQLLRGVGCARFALLGATIAALGSEQWVVASQALWQHGPAALALALAIVLLLRPDPGRLRLGLAGIATAAVVCCRPQNAVFAVPIMAWVAWRHRRDAVWFVPGALVAWTAMVGCNAWYFGSAAGGYAELEAMLPVTHGVAGYWTADALAGAAGTLVSPGRGLLVYCPWIAVALATLPLTSARLKPWPLVWLLLLALVPFFVQLALFSIWWAGHSFGPRFWTDAIPLFAIVLGIALEWSWDRCRPVFALLVLTGAFAIGVQALGAACYPSSWNKTPINVDQAHERLWDWHDTELTRCLAECPARW
jgi:hypothetical protein